MNTMLGETLAETAVLEGIVKQVVNALGEGRVDQAISYFAAQFIFNDYGIGLDFRDKETLAEFFRKESDLYPDSILSLDAVFVSGSYVISQWSLRKTMTDSGFGALRIKVPILVKGVSLVEIENNEIVKWSNYYDGLSSRRTALAAQFIEWIEP